MTLLTLIADSILLFGMICVSLYGASHLPAGAQVPTHFGPLGYNHWVPKDLGLWLWPAVGVVVYAIVVIAALNQRAHGGPAAPIGLTLALALMLANQIGAVRVAINRGDRG